MRICRRVLIFFLLLALVSCKDKVTESNKTEKPSNLKIKILDPTTIQLTWQDNSDNETGFKIYRNNNLISQTSANQTNFVDKNLAKQQYQYGVSAINQNDESIRISSPVDLREKPQPEISCKIFPESNDWNKDISNLPVHPNSQNYLESIGLDIKLHPDFGTVWNNAPNGIPFNIVDKNTPKHNVVFKYADESDQGPYPIPDGVKIEGGAKSDGDRHILLLDKDDCILYELFNAWPPNSPQNGNKRNWQADSGAIFDLNSNKLRADNHTSADAAGLAIFPGLVRYEEAVTNAEIKHALRFTISKTQKAFIHPATHYASSDTNPNLAPMGLRLRLKKDFDISKFSPEIQVILKALKKYGMFVADNGGDMFVSGAPNPNWNEEHLAELKQIPVSAFEAVYTGNIVGQDDAQWLPQAQISITPDSGKIFDNIKFDATGSYDADGSIERYTWYFGDGFKADGKTQEHIYQNSGRFMVRLDLTDNDGLTTNKVVPLVISNNSNSNIEKIEYVLDPSFESGKYNFESYYNKPKLSLNTNNPISGSKSLNIVFNDWSSAVLAIAYPWRAGPRANLLSATTKLRINSATKDKTIELCITAYTVDRNIENDEEKKQEACESVKTDKVGIIELSPSMSLDNSRNLNRLYFWINFSHVASADISIDDSHLVLEIIKGSGGNPE